MKAFLAVALIAIANAALVYTAVPTQADETKFAETALASLTQAEKDLRTRGDQKDGFGAAKTADETAAQKKYNDKLASEKNAWIEANSKTATAEEEEQINSMSRRGLTEQQQTDLTAYEEAVAAGTQASAAQAQKDAQAAYKSAIDANFVKLREGTFVYVAEDAAYAMAAAGAAVAAAAFLF